MKAQNLHYDIKKIISAVEFVSETKYKIDGLDRDIESIKIMDPSNVLSTTADASETLKQKYLNVLLTDIYNNYYSADRTISDTASDYTNNDFIIELSQVNNGSGFWEEGWQWIGKEAKTNKVVVQKDTMKFWVEEENVIRLNETACLVKIGKEKRFLNSYFYYAYGDKNKTEITNYANQTLRFYWNLSPEGAIEYIRFITKELNEKGIAFSTKVISDCTKYKRTDSGVLYIDASQLEKALSSIKYVYNSIQENIKKPVPMFAKQLYPGLGFAEDPRNGLSFGISRSKIITETLYRCFREGIKDPQTVQDSLFDSFKKEGISAAQPYASNERLTEYELILQKLN